MARKSQQSSRTTIAWILVTILVGGSLLTGLVGFFWWQQATSPVETRADNIERFVVQKGSGVKQIGIDLEEEGLIRSALVFQLMVRQLGIEQDIQAGSFELSPGQTTKEIAQALTRGTSDMWITVLEGWRREEIASNLAAVFAENDQEFDEAAFLTATEGREGFLFPDTYLVPLEISEEAVAELLISTFEQKVSDELEQAAISQGRTLQEIVTMASLIEREAKTDATRKMISGILWKRLANDWPLQVDATLQYALGFDESQNDWWAPPLAVDKEVVSPYNTYANPGLPPGPIASPSLSSIEAAVNPTESEYWYYITDNDGNMRYGVTLEDHNANVDRYLR